MPKFHGLSQQQLIIFFVIPTVRENIFLENYFPKRNRFKEPICLLIR
jgi:hypothetical protein